MSLKHLKAGSEMPPLTKGTLRLYSMVFCPYAQRARLVLAAKNIPYETVNINLQSKPEWYLKLNPAGQVPCLHFDDGRVLPESLINSEYLDQAYPQNKLMSSDPFSNAEQKLFIERFSKIITNFYKLFRSTEADALSALNDFTSNLKCLEGKLPVEGFLGGDQPAFVDYMIWPWLERVPVLSRMKDVRVSESEYPNLIAYMERMKQLPAVKETYIDPDNHIKFYKSYLVGEANYDMLY